MTIGVVNQIGAYALARLRNDHQVTTVDPSSRHEVADLVADNEVGVVRSGVMLDRTVLEQAGRLRLIVRRLSGRDRNASMNARRMRRVPPHGWGGPEPAVATIGSPGQKRVPNAVGRRIAALVRVFQLLGTKDRIAAAQD